MTKKRPEKQKVSQVAKVRRAKAAQPTAPLWLQVAQRVQIQEVRLVGCNCHIEPEAVTGKKTYDVEQQPARVRFNEQSGHIFVFSAFDLKAQQESKPEKDVIVINGTFLLVYKADSLEGLDQDAFQQFADVNGTYNAWPYWREFVQSVTTRMGLPPLTIQVYRVGGQPKQALPEKAEPAPVEGAKDASPAKATI